MIDRESVDFRVFISKRLHSYIIQNIQKYLKINYIVKKKIYIYYVFIVVKLEPRRRDENRDSVSCDYLA